MFYSAGIFRTSSLETASQMTVREWLCGGEGRSFGLDRSFVTGRESERQKITVN